MAEEVEEAPAAARLLIPFTLGWLAGGLHHAGAIGAPAVVVALAIGGITLRRTRSAAAVTLAGAAAGVACGALASVLAYGPPPSDHVARLVGQRIVAIEGVVVRSERNGERVVATVRADRARSADRSGPASGLVGITIAHAARDWPRGTRVRIVGKLRQPRTFANPGSYDHAGAQRRHGIRAGLFLWDERQVTELAPSTDFIDGARTALAAWIAHRTVEPARGYLIAVLLGATQSLDRATRDALTRTGLAHVVSVSGFHVAVAAGASMIVLRWLLLRLGTLALRVDVQTVAATAGLAPVATYAAIAGGTVPATRAFLTYAVLVAIVIARRPADGFRALAAVALAIASGTPDVAADVSFELSFAAVLALLALAHHLRTRPDDAASSGGAGFTWRRTLVVMPLLTSVAASAATAPLTAWHFQQVSLIAPLANLLALPLLGPATLLPGFAALPLAGVAPSVAAVLLAVASAAATVGLALASTLASIPGAALQTPMPTLLELSLCYAWPGVALWWRFGRPADGRRCRAVVGALALITITDVGYWVWERALDPDLRITFLAVGQGDAAVVELPRGAGVIVVDGGGLPGDFDPGERVIAPFLRSRKILRVDVLVMSHPQLDHFGGLTYLAEHFEPTEIWSNGTRGTGAAFGRLEAAVASGGVRSVALRRGMQRDLGDAHAEILHPASPDGLGVNDASLVLRLVYGDTAVLFTGDIEHVAEAELLSAGLVRNTDVLKVAHHGSATSSTASWLAAVHPRVAVVSSGEGNRFGFPAPAVVHRLHAAGARVWNTAEDGAVHVVSDGREVSVRAFRDARAQTRFELSKSLW